MLFINSIHVVCYACVASLFAFRGAVAVCSLPQQGQPLQWLICARVPVGGYSSARHATPATNWAARNASLSTTTVTAAMHPPKKIAPATTSAPRAIKGACMWQCAEIAVGESRVARAVWCHMLFTAMLVRLCLCGGVFPKLLLCVHNNRTPIKHADKGERLCVLAACRLIRYEFNADTKKCTACPDGEFQDKGSFTGSCQNCNYKPCQPGQFMKGKCGTDTESKKTNSLACQSCPNEQ